jgi:hypothetical protein
LHNAIQALEVARTTYGKTMAVTDGAAALVGDASALAMASLAEAAIAAGLDPDTVKSGIEAGKNRAELARQYRESTPPPKPARRAEQEAAGAPTRAVASNGVASPSLCEALQIQARERDWARSAREAVSDLNEDAIAPSKTAAATIEALLYELRSGLSCLEGDGAVNRLRSCDEEAIRTIAAQLLTWEGKSKPWLPPWTKQDVAKLVAIWEALR